MTERLARPGVWLVLLTLLAAGLRLYHLDFKSLWIDEAICYWASQTDFTDVIRINRQVRATPPLYTWIVHFVSAVGESESMLRAPAALAGVAAVPAMYYLARAHVPGRVALFPAALVAVSTTLVRFSQRVSEYALGFLMATLCCGVFVRYLRAPDWRRGALLSALLLLACGVHYGLALVNLAFNVVVLIELWRSDARAALLRSWVGVQLPLVAAGAVAFVVLNLSKVLRAGLPGGDSYLSGSFWDGSLGSLLQLTLPNTLRIFEFLVARDGLLLLLCGIGLLLAWRDERQRSAALLAVALGGVGFAAALAGLYPYDGTRHLFFLFPALLSLAAVGLAVLSRLEPRAPVAVVCGLVVGLLLLEELRFSSRWLRQNYPEHMRPIEQELAASKQPEDGVFVYTQALPAYRYYRVQRDPAHKRELLGKMKWLRRVEEPDYLEDDFQRLDAGLDSPQRLWLLFSHCGGNECEELLERARSRRDVELVQIQSGVALYLARPRSARDDDCDCGIDAAVVPATAGPGPEST